MLNIPIHFDDLLKIVDQLTEEQKQVLRTRLEDLDTDVDRPRIPGLHAGKIWMSDDFDDPLPDEFWLGEDA